MRKKYLKQQIKLLQNVNELRQFQNNHLKADLSNVNNELINVSKNYQTLLKRYSNEVIEANLLIERLTKSLEDTKKELEDVKTQNISLKRENLTFFQKNEILDNQLSSARNIITDSNKKLFIKENKKDVKKYCSNKSEGI